MRRLRRDRLALGFAALFAVIALALLAAPLYAGEIAHTTAADNHLTDTTLVDGKRVNVVGLDSIPIGPTWQSNYFLGADYNGRDEMVRLLYGARTSIIVGLGAVLLSFLIGIPLALAAGYRRGRTDALIAPLLVLPFWYSQFATIRWSSPCMKMPRVAASRISLWEISTW